MLAACMPLLARTQSIEAAVKDMSLCKIVGREESKVLVMTSVRLDFCVLTKEFADSNVEFANRKRKNEDTKTCYPGKMHDKNVSLTVQSFLPPSIDQNELKHCKNILF